MRDRGARLYNMCMFYNTNIQTLTGSVPREEVDSFKGKRRPSGARRAGVHLDMVGLEQVDESFPPCASDSNQSFDAVHPSRTR